MYSRHSVRSGRCLQLWRVDLVVVTASDRVFQEKAPEFETGGDPLESEAMRHHKCFSSLFRFLTNSTNSSNFLEEPNTSLNFFSLQTLRPNLNI